MLLSGGKYLSFLFGLSIGFVLAYLTITTSRNFGVPSSVVKWAGVMHNRSQHPGIVCMHTTELKVFDVFDILGEHAALDTRALRGKVRVLCWIMTSPSNLDYKTIHVKQTWARRCTKTLYICGENHRDPSFPTPGLNTLSGRQGLANKTWEALTYIYRHHLDDADWFLKADDDTYVIMENLRHFLSDKDPRRAWRAGHHLTYNAGPGFRYSQFQGVDYHSGGAGYVLSREALRRFGNHGDVEECAPLVGGAEDLELGACLGALRVDILNTEDGQGRTRFHCFRPGDHLERYYPKWYTQYDPHSGKKNMSDYPITFHYIHPMMMRLMEYFVYQLKVFGLHCNTPVTGKHTPQTDKKRKS